MTGAHRPAPVHEELVEVRLAIPHLGDRGTPETVFAPGEARDRPPSREDGSRSGPGRIGHGQDRPVPGGASAVFLSEDEGGVEPVPSLGHDHPDRHASRLIFASRPEATNRVPRSGETRQGAVGTIRGRFGERPGPGVIAPGSHVEDLFEGGGGSGRFGCAGLRG